MFVPHQEQACMLESHKLVAPAQPTSSCHRIYIDNRYGNHWWIMYWLYNGFCRVAVRVGCWLALSSNKLYSGRDMHTVIYSVPLCSEICCSPGLAWEHLSRGCIAASFCKYWISVINIHTISFRYEARQHKHRFHLIEPFFPPVRRRFESFFVFYFRLGLSDPTQIRFSYLNIHNWNIPLQK